jgi:hypothetical protein
MGMPVTGKVITMEWQNANPAAEIITENKTTAYHTYGQLMQKAFGYKKNTYKNIYPGIDIVYSFTSNSKTGFEYSLIVWPGADLGVVKMKYGGDVKNITTDIKGNLVVRSDINGIEESAPVSYYGDRVTSSRSGEIKSGFIIAGKEAGFSVSHDYDRTRAIVIDPFISSTGNLTGANAGKAKDVDFDYAGNIYVSGGGSGPNHQLAKYNSAGVLQWTFNGLPEVHGGLLNLNGRLPDLNDGLPDMNGRMLDVNGGLLGSVN